MTGAEAEGRFLIEVAELAGRDEVRREHTVESLELDSLTRFELAVLVEERFGARLSDDPTLDVQAMTIGGLIEFAAGARRTPAFRFSA